MQFDYTQQKRTLSKGDMPYWIGKAVWLNVADGTRRGPFIVGEPGFQDDLVITNLHTGETHMIEDTQTFHEAHYYVAAGNCPES